MIQDNYRTIHFGLFAVLNLNLCQSPVVSIPNILLQGRANEEFDSILLSEIFTSENKCKK